MDATTALLQLLLLLALGLVTPGPNALTCFAHSGMFGKKSNIPLITGMVVGFVTIELAVGFLVDSLGDNNTALLVLHWIGLSFLATMAIVMYRFDPSTIKVTTDGGKLGFRTGVIMQFVNGKEWAFIILMMSQFITPLGGGFVGIAVIISITVTLCVSAMIAWTFFGNLLSDMFSDENKGPWIFKICGVLLLILGILFLIRGPPIFE